MSYSTRVILLRTSLSNNGWIPIEHESGVLKLLSARGGRRVMRPPVGITYRPLRPGGLIEWCCWVGGPLAGVPIAPGYNTGRAGQLIGSSLQRMDAALVGEAPGPEPGRSPG